MKRTAIAATLCYVVTMCMTMSMAFPSSKLAVSEDLEAGIEWRRRRAPSHGCVEVSHSVGRSVFRSYACDGMQRPCVFTTAVDRCPKTALFYKPSRQRTVSIRGRDHLFRYYNQIGGACLFTILPDCCPRKASVMNEDCVCEDLPTGEKVCDPVGCNGEIQTEECKCEELPTGEKICDPVGCEGKINSHQIQDNKDAMKALLEYVIQQEED